VSKINANGKTEFQNLSHRGFPEKAVLKTFYCGSNSKMTGLGGVSSTVRVWMIAHWYQCRICWGGVVGRGGGGGREGGRGRDSWYAIS
jgi:hypothetical protein